MRIDIEQANAKALATLLEARPFWVDIRTAQDVIPGMHKKLILHSGPPVTWERMCGPQRGAVMGALIYEGLAHTPEEAEALAASGEITFDPCHHHQTVGPMAGVVSASMPVICTHNEAHGNMAFNTLNEGIGKVLRMGAYSPEVIERLKWMEKVLGPVLQRAIRKAGKIDLKAIMAQGLHMGDEVHNRSRACSYILFAQIAPYIIETMDHAKADDTVAVLNFLEANIHTFLGFGMSSAKASLDACRNIEGSTMVTVMARNGTDFGIQVSGLGDQWFTAPAAVPAIIQFVGGTVKMAMTRTLNMYEISLGENNMYQIPALDFRGSPTGIDIRKVVEKNLPPFIDTGVAHRLPGIGQVGAGLVDAPMEVFTKAILAFADKYAPK